jgi:hypothetical protein
VKERKFEILHISCFIIPKNHLNNYIEKKNTVFSHINCQFYTAKKDYLKIAENLKYFPCLTNLTIYPQRRNSLLDLELVDDCPQLISLDMVLDMRDSVDDYNLSTIPLHPNLREFEGYGLVFKNQCSQLFYAKISQNQKIDLASVGWIR